MTTAMLNWLHIYSPQKWHDPAYIVGTDFDLRRLRDAIDAALQSKRVQIQSFTNDGERYTLHVIMVSADSDAEPPYTDPMIDKTGCPPWNL